MKEVLIELDKSWSNQPVICAISLTKDGIDEFNATFEDEKSSDYEIHEPKTFIYEPNTAIRKAGFFKLVGSRFNLNKLDVNTHLYTSDESISNFSGRILKLKEILKPDKKAIKKHIPSNIINVISKNYPMDANEIKKKYRLRDGGDEFLIFCQVYELGNICLHCIAVT
jgi:hypothetical protein